MRHLPKHTKSKGSPTAVIFGIAVVGIIFIIHAFAGSTAFSLEPETGTITSPATVTTDTTASNGQAVRFAAATSGGSLTYAQVLAMVNTYASQNTGKNTDINRGTGFTRPGAAELRAVCGSGWTSVYPRLAWEYGGADHAWRLPNSSPLLICVHAPIRPPYTADWKYDSKTDHVTAMVFVKFPTQSPCGDNLTQCMASDTTNYEILVDESSGGGTDGSTVGLNLLNSSTDLNIRYADGSVHHLWSNI